MDKTDRIGLVLSGGGGKGAYQIGAWKALCELGWDVPVCGISGASVGALNAAVITCCTPEEGDKLWRNIDPLQFLDIDFPMTDGIFSREGLTRLINTNLNLAKIMQSPRALYANTTQVSPDGTRSARYFQLNKCYPADLLPILLASSAIPVAYPSVQIEGTMNEDGGVTDNLPIRPLYEAGIRKFILIDISEEDLLIPSQWPGAEFIRIKPSGDIGHLLDGTLDFTSEGASFRLALGYRDTLRVMRAFESGRLSDPAYREINRIEADTDYQAAKVDSLQSKLTGNVQEQIDNIDRLMKKFGV